MEDKHAANFKFTMLRFIFLLLETGTAVLLDISWYLKAKLKSPPSGHLIVFVLKHMFNPFLINTILTGDEKRGFNIQNRPVKYCPRAHIRWMVLFINQAILNNLFQFIAYLIARTIEFEKKGEHCKFEKFKILHMDCILKVGSFV